MYSNRESQRVMFHEYSSPVNSMTHLDLWLGQNFIDAEYNIPP